MAIVWAARPMPVTTSRVWNTTGPSRLWLGSRSWELLQAAHVSLGIHGLSSLHILRMIQHTEVTRQDLVKPVVYHCWVLLSHCWWIRPNRPRLQARTTAAEMGRLLWLVNPLVAGFCQVSSNTSPCWMVQFFWWHEWLKWHGSTFHQPSVVTASLSSRICHDFWTPHCWGWAAAISQRAWLFGET